jgi:hypothetical protein
MQEKDGVGIHQRFIGIDKNMDCHGSVRLRFASSDPDGASTLS